MNKRRQGRGKTPSFRQLSTRSLWILTYLGIALRRLHETDNLAGDLHFENDSNVDVVAQVEIVDEEGLQFYVHKVRFICSNA